MKLWSIEGNTQKLDGRAGALTSCLEWQLVPASAGGRMPQTGLLGEAWMPNLATAAASMNLRGAANQ
ncbi:MAG: hypothetical protein V4567_08205 [Pseudomonadota bacterium]